MVKDSGSLFIVTVRADVCLLYTSSATKGGINALTKALAKELAPSNIQVNAIACGAIDTEMNRYLSDDDLLHLIDEIPAGRLGRAEEVADLAYHLAYKSYYLTGEIIRLDGGWI